MKKLKFQILYLLIIFLPGCGSEDNIEIPDNFELQIHEEPEEEIKPFKVANIMPYFKNDKWGYANKEGEIVIPCKYESCGFFSDGMAWVEKEGKFGYIDTTGQLTITPQYTMAGDFKNGIAIVQNNKYKGIIDKTNKVIIPFEYEDLIISENDLVSFKQNQQWGALSITEGQIVNPIYDNGFTFENGFAVVERDRKKGVINKSGKEVVVCKYNEVVATRGKYFIVMTENQHNTKLYGVTNNDGIVIIPVEHKYIKEVINNSFIIANEKDVLVVNAKLDTLINPGFNSIKAGNTNLLAACSRGRWGYIDFKGDTIIPFQYSDAQGFIGNFAIVKMNDKYGLINNLNETIVPFEFREIKYADKNILKVFNHDGNYGFYNTKGEKLTECIYDELDYNKSGNERYADRMYENYESDLGIFYNNYAIVGINGRFGAISKNGKEIIKPYYHTLTSFDENDLAIGSYNGAYMILNSKGEAITKFKYGAIGRDGASGYYYSYYTTRNENHDRKEINTGFFKLDGTYFSNSTATTVDIKMEEEMILDIRKEYQRIVSLNANEKGKSASISENITATMKIKQLNVANNADKIYYEYYYADFLNSNDPFFILKTDKSSGTPQYDRYYFQNGKIIRWINKDGKQQIVANGPYAPEHDELFKARYLKTEYNNALLLRNNPHNTEVEQINQLTAQIETNIGAGRYKKGDIYESFEGEGGEKREEYLDNKGRTIYKYEYSGGEYSWGHTKEYYKNGELIYIFENQENTNFWGVGFYGIDKGNRTTRTYIFKDGKRRIYSEELFDQGNIIEITEE